MSEFRKHRIANGDLTVIIQELPHSVNCIVALYAFGVKVSSETITGFANAKSHAMHLIGTFWN